MKIAVASCGLGHVTRGIEAWAFDLAYALRERGEDVILCKGAGEAESEIERVVSCVKRSAGWVKKLPKRGLWRVGLGSAYEVEATTFALNLIRVLRREKIDILHVQDPLVALVVQRARNLKLVRTRAILGHGTNESLAFLNKIDFLQHLAPYHQEQVASQGVSKPTWTAIPNFIDTDAFHPGRGDAMRDELNIPRDATVVLSVAAIKRGHKRIDHLIEEFAKLVRRSAQTPAHLVIAGGHESDTQELLALGRAKIGDKFTALVRFPREEIAELYRCADLFVLCSIREMMPIALIEATASGLPCLVNDHPTLSWIIGDGGRTIDMNASGALADAMQQLVSDRELRRSLGGNAREHCLAHFSKDHVVSEILNYYRTVLAVGVAEAGAKVVPAIGGPLPADCCESAVPLTD
ncbi:MAG TPA: glycosyltransferase family 4 protein [Tepidisphaeraceae bacterium]|jgi:glycosyltransferase involved in cell wall biosynthesis